MEVKEDEYAKKWASGENPSSFAGETIFLRQNPGLKRSRLRDDILPKLVTYTKFRAAKPPRVYNPYFVRTKRKVIQSDIIFMRDPIAMRRANKGFQYILILQDIFSRKVWASPLKSKHSSAVLEGLVKILKKMKPFHPEARFVIDRGTEYLNAKILTTLNKFGLKVTHPSDGHASHVERANLSLQRLLFQKMEEKGGARKWVPYLNDCLDIMNNRHHRIIRMTPNEAEDDNNKLKVNKAMAIYRQKAIKKEVSKKHSKFKIGDLVRVKKEKRVFSRGYTQTFTNEIFKVKRIVSKLPITMYTLEEFDGSEEIEGNFYPEELSLVKGEVFKIEKVLQRRMVNGEQRLKVKWEGFPAKYNSWISAGDIKRSDQ
jgi:hypothetical protein